MKIDLKKSGMNVWSLSILYAIMVVLMVYMGIKAYNAPYNEHLQLGEFIAYDSGDTYSYIASIEKYIQTGHYDAGENPDKLVGRGPYYGSYYYIFRQFLPVAKAYDALAIFQILWYVIAVIVLMLIVEPYLKYKSLVWLIPMSIGILHTGFCFLPRILTDPIAVSQLVCFAYFYIRFNRTGSLWALGWAALFIAMASVMKPYLLPIYAICFFDWAISNKVLDIKRWAKYVGIMAVPLIVICLPFTIRNAVKLHIFAPVQNSSYAGGKPDPVNATMRQMVCAWGELHIEWGEDALGTYFMPVEGFTYTKPLPSHIYTDEYDENDLRRLAEDCQAYQKMPSGAEKDSVGRVLIERMNGYRSSYIAEHPLWRVRATIKQLSCLVLPATSFTINTRHSGLRHYISNGINLFSWSLEWIILIFGTIGLIVIACRYKDMRIIAWLAFYHMFFFALILGGEPRYYWIGNLMSLLGFVVILDTIIELFSKKK